jgi:hypothetical protein
MAPRPLETDEPFDRIFSRPLARLLVAFLRHTAITPNQVTVLAALAGIGTGISLALQSGIGASAFTLAYLVLDCADGQLARFRGGGGMLGRAADGLGDYVAAVAMHVGLGVWLADSEGPILGPLWAVAAGLAAAWASFLLDRYKRRYRGDMDDVGELTRAAAEAPGYRGRVIASLIPYARRLAGDLVVPDLDAYRARMRGPLGLLLLNGPTMHFFLMAVFFAFDRPLLYAWVAFGPLTLFAVLTLAWQLRLERRAPAVVAPRGAAT